MGMFDGFPFTTKEERERRRKDFEKRVVPFGLEAQREKLKETLAALFPKVDSADLLFAYYDAKDAYTKKDTPIEGYAAARARLSRLRWIDATKTTVLLKLIELECEATSLDDYPTAEQVQRSLSGGADD